MVIVVGRSTRSLEVTQMWPRVHRPISKEEAAVVIAALHRAGTGLAASGLESQVPSLTVVAYCECGCGSVSFAVPEGPAYGIELASGCGLTSEGATVGVLVFGNSETIESLEIWQADEEEASFPKPESVRKWLPGEVNRGDF